jgi:hypothetical protein
MVAGLILLVTGLILAVGGTALIFLSLDEKPTTAQLRGAPVSPAQIAPPSSSPQAAAAPEPRRFTNKTARELLALYDGRTPFQAEPLIAPHKGLWIRVNGQVLNVLPDGRPNHAVVILKDGDRIVECRVGPQGHSRSSKLNKDDSVVIQGRISDIQNGSQLYLLDCEFVDST